MSNNVIEVHDHSVSLASTELSVTSMGCDVACGFVEIFTFLAFFLVSFTTLQLDGSSQENTTIVQLDFGTRIIDLILAN